MVAVGPVGDAGAFGAPLPYASKIIISAIMQQIKEKNITIMKQP